MMDWNGDDQKDGFDTMFEYHMYRDVSDTASAGGTNTTSPNSTYHKQVSNPKLANNKTANYFRKRFSKLPIAVKIILILVFAISMVFISEIFGDIIALIILGISFLIAKALE